MPPPVASPAFKFTHPVLDPSSSYQLRIKSGRMTGVRWGTALHGRITALHGRITALHGRITALHGRITALHGWGKGERFAISTGYGSSLISVEWRSSQPAGRKRIAQRFIAGSRRTRASSPGGTTEIMPSLRSCPTGVLSSRRDFLAAGSRPSDESLGYFRSSLRDYLPAPSGSGLYVVGRESLALFHRKQRGAPAISGKCSTSTAYDGTRTSGIRSRGCAAEEAGQPPDGVT